VVGDYGIHSFICIQGQDGPIEHCERGPWARRRGVTAGQRGPRPPPSLALSP
jgi:hypothetical protein